MQVKFKKGQSLWEVVLALAIAALVALGLVRSTTSSVKSSRFSADQSEATALAQKKVSEMVAYKNENPTSFWNVIELISPDDTTPAGSPLSGETEISPYCLVVKTYNATNKLTPFPGDTAGRMARIAADVYWDEIEGEAGHCGARYSHSVHFETYVTN